MISEVFKQIKYQHDSSTTITIITGHWRRFHSHVNDLGDLEKNYQHDSSTTNTRITGQWRSFHSPVAEQGFSNQ